MCRVIQMSLAGCFVFVPSPYASPASLIFLFSSAGIIEAEVNTHNEVCNMEQDRFQCSTDHSDAPVDLDPGPGIGRGSRASVSGSAGSVLVVCESPDLTGMGALLGTCMERVAIWSSVQQSATSETDCAVESLGRHRCWQGLPRGGRRERKAHGRGFETVGRA